MGALARCVGSLAARYGEASVRAPSYAPGAFDLRLAPGCVALEGDGLFHDVVGDIEGFREEVSRSAAFFLDLSEGSDEV